MKDYTRAELKVILRFLSEQEDENSEAFKHFSDKLKELPSNTLDVKMQSIEDLAKFSKDLYLASLHFKYQVETWLSVTKD